MLPELSLTAVWPVTALPAVQDFLFSTLFFEWAVSFVACSNFCWSTGVQLVSHLWCVRILLANWIECFEVARHMSSDMCRACVEQPQNNK